MSDEPPPPRLSGQHFRITVAEQSGFVDFESDEATSLAFSGYSIDILKTIAKPNLADFSYELFPPSGYGELCSPHLERGDNATAATFVYDETYYAQFNCGQGDVNDMPARKCQPTCICLRTTYMCVTPARPAACQSFHDLFHTALGMIGTPTGIKGFVKQQEEARSCVCSTGCCVCRFPERSLSIHRK